MNKRLKFFLLIIILLYCNQLIACTEDACEKHVDKFTKYKLNTIGQRATKGYFLIDGFVRTYMISENGKEINRHIYPSGSFIAAFTSLILQKGSHTEIECLTDCKIVEYNYFKFLKIDYLLHVTHHIAWAININW